MTFHTILAAVPGVATAIGVAIAAWQLRMSRKLAQLSFEDSLNKEYRSLAKDIPVNALIGEDINEHPEFSEVRECIYNYVDLCNEQIFLRKKGRITESTWREWAVGMQMNLNKPTFRRVWSEIKGALPQEFQELRKAEETHFKLDPRMWKR